MAASCAAMCAADELAAVCADSTRASTRLCEPSPRGAGKGYSTACGAFAADAADADADADADTASGGAAAAGGAAISSGRRSGVLATPRGSSRLLATLDAVTAALTGALAIADAAPRNGGGGGGGTPAPRGGGGGGRCIALLGSLGGEMCSK